MSFVFETEADIDENLEPVIYIPKDFYYNNNCLFEDDGNTRWHIRVTIEKI